MSPDEAFDLLEAIAVISGSKDKLKKAKGVESSEDNPNSKVRRPPVNFAKCGIPIGAELVFISDPSIKVIVVDERKVQYGEELTSLSAVAQTQLKVSAVAGPHYFTYNGKRIDQIAEETQWKN